jgi:hypothetical protein
MRLSIRSEQMSVIETVAQENFVRRLAGHLRENYAAAVVTLPSGRQTTTTELPEEKLYSLIRAGIARARGHEIGLESATAGFVAVMFEIAPNFDTHRLSQVLLNDEEIEPNSRLDELLKVLTEKNWESIRADYDPAAWEAAANDEAEEGKTDRPAVEEKNARQASPGADYDQTVFNY